MKIRRANDPIDNTGESRQRIEDLQALEVRCQQLEQALEERKRLAQLAADVSVALVSGRTFRDTLRECAEALVQHLGAAFARIWTLNPKQNVLELQASAGIYTRIDGTHSRVPVGKFKIGLIAKERKPHLTNAVIGDPLVHDQEWAKRESMVAFAGYPLIVEDRLVGVMAMFSRKQLTEMTVEAMASIANSIALGIENKRAEEEREALVEELRRVNSQLAISSLQAKEQAEVARHRSSELEAVLDGIADGVFVCDKESRIVDVNKAGLKIIGLTSKDEALRPETDYLRLLDLRHPDGRPIAKEELVLSRALRGETIREFEQLARDIRTGRDIYFMISAAPLRDREGRIIGAVAVLTDITRIRELDKLKDDFISVAAHELKTPVAIMKGYAQALLRTIEEMPEPRRKMLDGINRGADRIDRIVKDLLDISRLHLGHLELSVESIDLPEMVEDVVNRAAATTTKHRVRVVRAEPVVVQGDRDRLEQVLFSLLDNAIKYSPKGGDIDVAVEVRDNEAVVSVTDRGVGIPKEKQSHIFERFYSAHTGTPYDYGGMGVGLFISREIVRRHGGRMWFESEAGKGSSFRFSLLLRVEHAGS